MLRLQDFLGEWRDSLGHEVRVRWAQHGNRAGELDVELLKPRSNTRGIRLNVKALDQGRFQCGHFELKLDGSSTDKIIWADMRTKGKVSVWDREAQSDRSRSRSRSPEQNRQKCGCVLRGNLVLRCIQHLPLLPPRSVLHDISTPGAWAPPAMAPRPAEAPRKPYEAPPALWIGASQASPATAPKIGLSSIVEQLAETPPATAPEINEKLSEVDRLFEAYDDALLKPQAAPDPLQQAKAELLVKHSQAPAAELLSETKAQLQDVLGQAKEQLLVKHFKKSVFECSPRKSVFEGSTRDPRMRRKVVAPTGGA